MKILVVSTDRPGWGGAAIAMEGLSLALEQAGHYVTVVFSGEERVRPVTSLVEEIRPDLVIGKNYFGYRPILDVDKAKFPKTRFVYLTSGLRSAYSSLNPPRGDFIGCRHDLLETFGLATSAMAHCHKVVCNSELVHGIYERSFPQYAKKISQTIFYDCLFTSHPGQGRSWGERVWDVVFSASDWGRSVKNYKMACILTSNLRNRKVLVVGKKRGDSGEFKGDYLLSHGDMLRVLQDARVVVIPSLFDSSPNLLVEAVNSGANVVASSNVGNSHFLDLRLVCDRCNEGEFLDRIRLALTKPFPAVLPDPSGVLSSFMEEVSR